MLQPLNPGRLSRRRIVGLTAVALLILTALGIGMGLALTPGKEPDRQPQATTGAGLEPQFGGRGLRPASEPGGLRTIAEPEAFARAVAAELFEWNTAAGASNEDSAARLLAVAAPTDDAAGLSGDIANYLPTPEAWATLRAYRTRQRLDLTSAVVPGLWPQAVAEAGPDGLPPGTAAYTITGVRRRAGVWDGARVTSEHDVRFTVFLVCAPSYPTCRLLRLSLPDEPLR